MKAELTLSEKTTAMEKAIKMAKEIHNPSVRIENYAYNQSSSNNETMPAFILETAKQIFDWLTA